jgi:hypothetical protein
MNVVDSSQSVFFLGGGGHDRSSWGQEFTVFYSVKQKVGGDWFTYDMQCFGGGSFFPDP